MGLGLWAKLVSLMKPDSTQCYSAYSPQEMGSHVHTRAPQVEGPHLLPTDIG